MHPLEDRSLNSVIVHPVFESTNLSLHHIGAKHWTIAVSIIIESL